MLAKGKSFASPALQRLSVLSMRAWARRCSEMQNIHGRFKIILCLEFIDFEVVLYLPVIRGSVLHIYTSTFGHVKYSFKQDTCYLAEPQTSTHNSIYLVFSRLCFWAHFPDALNLRLWGRARRRLCRARK